ncbi:MAG: YncE family protein, partial [Actinobacteria bacterium]|nr:YncE family protein [Actinomycetota bacterium]
DGDNRLLVVDVDTSRTVARFGLGDGPDVIAFDAGLGRLYVAAESGTVTVFSVTDRTVRRLGQAHLADHAHSVAVDPSTHRVFFPLESVGGHPVLRVMAAT